MSLAPLDIPSNTQMKNQYFVLPGGLVFVDKVIPKKFEQPFVYNVNDINPCSYFVDLHRKVFDYGAYNYAGARVKLEHNVINVAKFRELLPVDFEDISILQYLEFGFPIGLNDDYSLFPVLKNHSSSYSFFTHIDKFISKELLKTGLTGPFSSSPFEPIMTSPLMTAIKKPGSRRTVFDASFSDFSLNVNTPEKSYLYEDYEFTFPKVDDFASLISELGHGCYMWKRYLSRFFLQLPLDPLDYDKVAFVWRGSLWFFTSFVWGCRHAGMNGQRVSSLIAAIHRSLGYQLQCNHRVFGCKSDCVHVSSPDEARSVCTDPFNCLNYSDDFAGAEIKLIRSTLSFNALGSLLEELNVDESTDKQVSPCQVLKYLGIEFDSVLMVMCVDHDKCLELKNELVNWFRRTKATKSELQSILGKLLWVARAVKFSRCFVMRIIAETKTVTSQTQKATLSDAIRKYFLWWYRYLQVFNGVEIIIPSHVQVQIAGDACPVGLGCWNTNTKEYFSRRFPLTLQDSQIPIHIKEFLCLIISAKVWGKTWAGKRVEIFCDNDSVCDVVTYLKPKDNQMQRYLREFLYWVCYYNFQPVVSKIGTKENLIADFISRNYDLSDAQKFFSKRDFSCCKVEV